MQTVYELCRFIRDYGQSPRHTINIRTIPFRWHQLWAAMDVIEDTDLAIGNHLEADFPSDMGERYLRVYGVLQALFLQQDAVRHVIEALRPAMMVDFADVLKDIRGVRNASVGHPTELRRGRTVSAHGIVQSSMNRRGFTLASFSETGASSFHAIDLVDLAEKQKSEIVRILSEVVDELKREDNEHKAKFRREKICDCLRGVGYAIEKIGEELRGGPVCLGTWAVEDLNRSLRAFVSALEKREMELRDYPSIQYHCSELEYPLGELAKFMRREACDIPSCLAAGVYAESLRAHFDALFDIASEIDTDYSAQEDETCEETNATTVQIVIPNGISDDIPEST